MTCLLDPVELEEVEQASDRIGNVLEIFDCGWFFLRGWGGGGGGLGLHGDISWICKLYLFGVIE